MIKIKIQNGPEKFFFELSESKRRLIEKYMVYLLECNKKINLISRKVSKSTLLRLISETVFLGKLINGSTVIDAGSGNGILGIPLSIMFGEKKFVLCERKEKKAAFLKEAKENLSLSNVYVCSEDVVDYLKKGKLENTSLIARGFPDIEMLIVLFYKKIVNEVLIITSAVKIKKNKKNVENTDQKIYNIPCRNYLKILKMENVSRETTEKKGRNHYDC